MPDRNFASVTTRLGLADVEQDFSAARRPRTGHNWRQRAGEPRSFAPPAASAWLPLDLNETARAYIVTAELPGIDEKDLEVTLRDNILTISGEKRDARGGEESDRVYIERSYGRFERTVPFDTGVDVDKVQANARNGVLTVTLPKGPRAQNQARRIEVERREF